MMNELSDLIMAASPGSVVEHDLLTLMRTAEQRDFASFYDKSRSQAVTEFFFSDYVGAIQASMKVIAAPFDC